MTEPQNHPPTDPTLWIAMKIADGKRWHGELSYPMPGVLHSQLLG